MADVYTYVDSTGVITPDAGVINTQVQDEYLATFGADLDTSPNTPQGVLITTESLARIALANNNATLANQINPNEAGGIFLDALLALTGATRSPAVPSLVFCTIVGVAGTSIPEGAQISDASGVNVFQSDATVVIPSGGTLNNVAFTSVIKGAIPGTAGTLTKIISNILGWSSVTNPADAILGSATQSDVSARQLRLDTLGEQGFGLAQAIQAAVYQLAPGTSMSFRENVESSPATIDGVPMVANSIYACVFSSATLEDIAGALNDTKSGGCAYNNGLGIPQSVNITNAYSGQVIPVLFDTPSIVTISMTITVHAFTAVQNVQAAVQQAVMDYVEGRIPNETGFVVGASVSPFQIAGAINILVPGLFVQAVEIGIRSFTQIGTIANTSPSVTNLTYNAPVVVGGDTYPGIEIGMTVTGDGIPASTTVSALVGATEVTLNNNATASGVKLLTFSPTLALQTTEIPIGIWQKATTNPVFITVLQV